MRVPRIAILGLFLCASTFLFCRSSIGSARHPAAAQQRAASVAPHKPRLLSSPFAFSSPFNIFPPNAAISLTDDNSTSFPARPAAFGPALPPVGLSGRLWIGSGFADEGLDEGESEGELGCSDLLGWHNGRRPSSSSSRQGEQSQPVDEDDEDDEDDDDGEASSYPYSSYPDSSHPDSSYPDASYPDASYPDASYPDASYPDASYPPYSSSGTFPGGGPRADRKAYKARSETRSRDGTDDHLHAGLSRSRSARSRRGAGTHPTPPQHADIQSIQEAAEITGTIVLLSRGGCGFLEKVMWAQRRGAIAVIVGDNQKGGPLIQMFARHDVDNVTIPSVFTSRTTAHLLSSLTHPGSFARHMLDQQQRQHQQQQRQHQQHQQHQQQQQQQQQPDKRHSPTTPARTTAHAQPGQAPSASDRETGATTSPDGRRRVFRREGWFWRLFHGAPRSVAAADADRNRPPSSGRLDWVVVDEWSDESGDARGRTTTTADDKGAPGSGGGTGGGTATRADGFRIGVQDWRDPDLVFYPDRGPEDPTGTGKRVSAGAGTVSNQATPAPAGPDGTHGTHGTAAHDGLWVTITPTSSASPFFDTVLVLVFSPLITLTVVYAILVLRATLRRRRWRAPKSVVERLPVRTYHAVPASPVCSPRLPSAASASPTTPLLQSPSPAPAPSPPHPSSSSWSRPWARMTTGLSEAASESESAPQRASGWRKYMARQMECVVCLEEYVDGVSRVMRLPCGHEFHVHCITPWLTTRRRTCPICKGDVVKALDRGAPPLLRADPFTDHDPDRHHDDDADHDDDAAGHGPRVMLRPRSTTVGWSGLLATAWAVGSLSRPRRAQQPADDEENGIH